MNNSLKNRIVNAFVLIDAYTQHNATKYSVSEALDILTKHENLNPYFQKFLRPMYQQFVAFSGPVSTGAILGFRATCLALIDYCHTHDLHPASVLSEIKAQLSPNSTFSWEAVFPTQAFPKCNPMKPDFAGVNRVKIPLLTKMKDNPPMQANAHTEVIAFIGTVMKNPQKEDLQTLHAWTSQLLAVVDTVQQTTYSNDVHNVLIGILGGLYRKIDEYDDHEGTQSLKAPIISLKGLLEHRSDFQQVLPSISQHMPAWIPPSK